MHQHQYKIDELDEAAKKMDFLKIFKTVGKYFKMEYTPNGDLAKPENFKDNLSFLQQDVGNYAVRLIDIAVEEAKSNPVLNEKLKKDRKQFIKLIEQNRIDKDVEKVKDDLTKFHKVILIDGAIKLEPLPGLSKQDEEKRKEAVSKAQEYKKMDAIYDANITNHLTYMALSNADENMQYSVHLDEIKRGYNIKTDSNGNIAKPTKNDMKDEVKRNPRMKERAERALLWLDNAIERAKTEPKVAEAISKAFNDFNSKSKSGTSQVDKNKFTTLGQQTSAQASTNIGSETKSNSMSHSIADVAYSRDEIAEKAKKLREKAVGNKKENPKDKKKEEPNNNPFYGHDPFDRR